MTWSCQCAAAGDCPILKRTMTPHLHRICKGDVLTPEKCDHYRQHWLADANPLPVVRQNPALVGNRLAAFTRWLGLEHCGGCTARQETLNWLDRWVRNRVARITCRGTLAVVTSYFNPCGYPALAENYRLWRDTLGSAPLYTAEVAYGDAAFIGDGPLQLRGGDRHVLFQKERLLNLVVERLPPRFDKVAFIDADFVSRDDAWYDRTSELLDTFAVVQMAETFIINGKQSQTCAARKGQRPCSWGGAWAARREVFPLYDAGIIGGGDSLAACAWLGIPRIVPLPSAGWLAHYRRWAKGAWRKVQGNVGCVPGELFHLDHGSHRGRQYNERYELVKGVDPERDLEIDGQGLWRWKDERFAANLRKYFERRQDG